jgi:dTDP-glucose 4,6-dehydratase
LPVDDPKQRQPDITRARSILGWGPKISRSEGLRITYDYFRTLPEDRLYEEAHHKDFGKYKN